MSFSEPPEWVKSAVFYQIFPDRFAKSDRVTKPHNLLDWSDPPHDQKYHGGDLLGIVEKLDYLQELGITALYLNPIFQSACNHRYHTHDYYQVDPLLGGNEALRELITEAHGQGIRVMLDGVFNHASRGFFMFNDILENGPHSPWIDWFIVEDWPLGPYRGDVPANYVGWADNRALPKFNTDNPQVREYLMQVSEYWVREFDIDGWRLDVAAEIKTDGFWEEFRQRVRAIKPDLYIVGEIWHIAPEWLAGDRFDANMNYPFTGAIGAFVGQDNVSPVLAAERGYEPYPSIDAAEFSNRIEELLHAYGWHTTLAKYNQLDSHDTCRFLSLCSGDRSSLKLATLFQMCYPGTPSIYYGNEIGIRGSEDPNTRFEDADARWPFPWEQESEWDHDMLNYFKAAIRLRHETPVLSHGRYSMLYAVGNLYVFARHTESNDEAALIALNVGQSTDAAVFFVRGIWPNGQVLRPIFGDHSSVPIDDQVVTLTLPSRSAVVLA